MTRKISLMFLACMLLLLPLTSCSKPKPAEVSTKKSAPVISSSVSSFSGKHDSLWSLKARDPFLIGGYGDNFSYDGSNITPMFGKAMVKVDSKRDTGTMVVKLKGTINPQIGKSYTGDIKIYYKIKKGGLDYKEGGVADFIYLHGDTKQGSPVMPKVRTYLAAWGSADVYVNDRLVYQNLDGHMMLTERSRDIKTRAISNKDKSGFYNPKDPENASIADPDSRELHFVAHSSKADAKNFPPQTVWIHINFENVKDMSDAGPSAAYSGKHHRGVEGRNCRHHSRVGPKHGMHGSKHDAMHSSMHGKFRCAHDGGVCKGDCNCGCKEGKPCVMEDGKCEGGCGCGCEKGKACAMDGAICAPGCDCGCNDGKPCTCSGDNCSAGCDCGCNDGKPCTCAHADGVCKGDCDCGCKEGKPCTCAKHSGMCGPDCACGCDKTGICTLKDGNCGEGCKCGCTEGKPCKTADTVAAVCKAGCGCGCHVTGICTMDEGMCNGVCGCDCLKGKTCDMIDRSSKDSTGPESTQPKSAI